MDIIEQLQQAGLTGNEARVYLELTKRGELSANKIAKNLGMDRTLIYSVLNHLIEKGHVNYIIKESKKIFIMADPASLLNTIKAKEMIVNDLIISLTKVKKESQQEVEIKVLEGKEGIRTLFRTFLQTKCETFDSFGATGRAYDMLYEAPAIAKEFQKNKITARIIYNSKYRGNELEKYPNLDIKYLDIQTEASTTIFGDYISIHMIKDKPIVILIKNKDMARSYKNYFDFIWQSAKK